MAGVIPDNMEQLAPVDIHRVAAYIKGILGAATARSDSLQQRSLDHHRRHSHLEHRAEKSMVDETTPRGIRRLQRLVLG